MSTKQENRSMTVEKASSIIIKPYITEKTFNLIEKENKLTFIVAEKASKNQIVKALQILYESEASEVNTVEQYKVKRRL
jgi:large subunit ribosomal protein L23